MEDYKFLFKVVLVGNAGVGKTCLVRRFTQGMFPPGQGATIGVDFMIKTVEIDGEKIKVSIILNCKGNNKNSIAKSRNTSKINYQIRNIEFFLVAR